MKIVFVTPSLATGGRERVMSSLMNFCIRKGEEVHLVLYAKNRIIYFPLDSRVIIHEPSFGKCRSDILYAIKSILFIRKTVCRIKANRMVSFEEKWNRFALLATIGLNIRKIISNRNNPYRDYGFIDRKLAKWLYPKADLLIAQTQIAKDVYEKEYVLKKCIVIGNPINQLNIDFSTCKRENIVVSVGRLMNSKNHDRLVRIFSKTDYQNWKLVIVGGDFANHNNSTKLNKIIKELHLEDKVILAGAQKDVNSYLLKSKIFAFTSEMEGFPNVIGEAMAAQLPVVSYDCVAGPRDMITDGEDGFLIPVYDDDLFIEKLNKLMTDECLRVRMAENAVNSIRKFDSEMILGKFYNAIVE